MTFNSDGSQADIQNIINGASCHDGDIITLPNGSFTWSGTLSVTKAVTLQGNSTVSPHGPGGTYETAGIWAQPFQGDPPSGSHVDNTIVIHNSLNKIIDFRATTGTVQRVTGISFLPSVSNPQSGAVFEINGDPSTPLRVDHCFFGPINVVANIIWNNAYNYGVFDHNVSVCEHGVIQNGPGRFNGDQGDSAFEETVGFGGPKFFFVEDNWLKHGGDIAWGGKSCFRYNHLHGETTLGPPAPGTVVGAVLVCHGTGRQGAGRGGRAYEVYNNDFHWNDDNKSMDGSDTGAAIWHDNTWTNNNKNIGGIDFNCYRSGLPVASPYYCVSGTPGQTWDLMATRVDGTHVDGEDTFVFASGTSAAGTSDGQVVATGSPGWTTNQWQGYHVRRADGQSNGIESNNGNTLQIRGVGFAMGWTSGQGFEIVKPLRYLDQTGIGWGDHIDRASPAWPHQDAHPEPCYSWNNINSDDGSHINFSTPDYLNIMVQQNRDYYQDTAMPGYVPYTYPHPLVSGDEPAVNSRRTRSELGTRSGVRQLCY